MLRELVAEFDLSVDGGLVDTSMAIARGVTRRLSVGWSRAQAAVDGRTIERLSCTRNGVIGTHQADSER